MQAAYFTAYLMTCDRSATRRRTGRVLHASASQRDTCSKSHMSLHSIIKAVARVTGMEHCNKIDFSKFNRGGGGGVS